MNSFAQNALSAYQTNKNSSISYDNPHELILRLMNGAIERIAQAKGAIQQKNIKDKGETISKAIAIVGGLSACLDHSHNSDLSKNLESLYDYMGVQLLNANVQNDIAKLDEVSRLLREIKSGWEQIAPDPSKEAG
jgi:flagellar protein FliS